MSETETFDVLLAPEDVGIANASETREFTISVEQTVTGDALQRAIFDHVNDENILDPWAFRKHWAVALLVRRDGSATQRLRDALLWTEDGADIGTYAVRSFNLKDDRTQTWQTTTLTLEPHIDTNLDNWVASLKREHTAVSYSTQRCLHESMLRTVADKDPTLVDLFWSDPIAAQKEFTQVCLSYGDLIAKGVTDVSP